MSDAPRSTKPFSRFEWMIAGRYLRARRNESFISVIAVISFLGIMLGVAVLIIVMAVMNGFRIELLDKILGFNGHIVVQGAGTHLKDFDATAKELRAIDGVISVSPIVEGQVMAQSKVNMSGVLVRGMRRADVENLKAFRNGGLKAGTMEDYQGKSSILIGTRLSEHLRVVLGDKIMLTSPKGPTTAFGSAPRRKAYTIVGLFEIGMSEYDASIIFMPLEQSQLFFGYKDAVSGIELKIARPDNVWPIRNQVILKVDPSSRVYDWQQTNQSFVSALMVERNVMFLILTLIILIAALNIISGLIMLVKDKGSDIAILRTMGATQGSILRIFFIAGASIGFVGTLAGVGLGVLFCANIEYVRQALMFVTGANLFDPNIYFLYTMPAEMDSGETVTVIIMALVLSFFATLYPAWRAARLDPVEALRYE